MGRHERGQALNADELVALYTVAHVATTSTNEMRLAHFNHLVARLDELELRFEDVVEAGMARLLGLSPRDIGNAWGRQPLVRIVNTDSWQFQVGLYLQTYENVLSKRDRTYLEMMLSRRAIMGNDMIELEHVFQRAFEAGRSIDWGERMEEFRSPVDQAAPTEQLDLDV